MACLDLLHLGGLAPEERGEECVDGLARGRALDGSPTAAMAASSVAALALASDANDATTLAAARRRARLRLRGERGGPAATGRAS